MREIIPLLRRRQPRGSCISLHCALKPRSRGRVGASARGALSGLISTTSGLGSAAFFLASGAEDALWRSSRTEKSVVRGSESGGTGSTTVTRPKVPSVCATRRAAGPKASPYPRRNTGSRF